MVSCMNGLTCILFMLTINLIIENEMTLATRFPTRKAWWSKQITYDLHSAGHLTGSQVKFAKEAGFKSLISVVVIPSGSNIGSDTTDPLLSTSEEIQLTQDIGMPYSMVLEEGNYKWHSLDALQRFSTLFEAAEKPVLVHCVASSSATFLGLMYYFNRSKHDVNAQPKMDLTDFFRRASALGHDYTQMAEAYNTILTVDGSIDDNPRPDVPKPDLSLPSWNKMAATWKIKPLAKNIYLTGQIGSNELPILKSLGFNVLVNLRKGVTSGGSPSQEESILLNVHDRTGTYDADGNPVRQTHPVLEANRVDPSKPNTYISPTSQHNYQLMNELQFGDTVGYNETLQRLAVKEAGMRYAHYPVGGVYQYGMPLWEAYKEQLTELGNASNSNILVQCRTGYRSAVLAILVHGCLYDVGSDESLQMAHRLGYEYLEDEETAVVNMFRTILDNREIHCGKSSAQLSGQTSTISLFTLFFCLCITKIYMSN